jgi:hypothetical protein
VALSVGLWPLAAEIMGSHPACGLDVCLLLVLCFLSSKKSVRRADQFYRGVLLSVECHIVWTWSLDNEKAWPSRRPLRNGGKNYKNFCIDGDRKNQVSCRKYIYIYIKLRIKCSKFIFKLNSRISIWLFIV